MKKKEALKTILICLFLLSIHFSCFDEGTKTVPSSAQNIFYSNDEIKKELDVIINSLQKEKYSYFDTCRTSALQDHLKNNKQKLSVSFVDLELLEFILAKDSTIKEETILKWHFNRSRQFNELYGSFVKNDAAKSSELWNELVDKQYILILKERSKILPRTNFDYYVLGGMFEGGVFLYDIKNFRSICYFHLRYNNTSNKKEFYKDYDEDMYRAMEKQLIEQLKVKIGSSLGVKLGIDASAIDFSFIE